MLFVVMGCSVVFALLVVEVIHRLVRRFTHSGKMYRPGQVFGAFLAAQISLSVYPVDAPVVLHVLGIALILASAWLLAALISTLVDISLSRIRTDVTDNRHARRVHTQVTLVRRLVLVVIGVLAVGAILMTFPGARAVGSTVLASAAVIGAVAAFSAQSLLGNLISGLQIAFSDAVRLDDVVVVEGEWGRVEDITLTYVVLHLWDDRRLVLPTSHFLKTPFENWTRTQSALLGTVELDLDWTVPVEAMRQEMRSMLEGSDLWDGRVSVLQVTQATQGFVRVRALVSAADAGKLWDLRCLTREHLVDWVHRQHTGALPQIRTRAVTGVKKAQPASDQHTDARVFGESVDGALREQAFAGPKQ
ncbi:mechanosensitive ion channel family protein [Lentzea sp. NPDC058436]|uniref:mechanosensitive ion channel family protein n=1 Tax=Lentzea sp. NPDC058436 TaxID=3346499 RepID=UPI00364799FC